MADFPRYLNLIMSHPPDKIRFHRDRDSYSKLQLRSLRYLATPPQQETKLSVGPKGPRQLRTMDPHPGRKLARRNPVQMQESLSMNRLRLERTKMDYLAERLDWLYQLPLISCPQCDGLAIVGPDRSMD